MVGCAASPLLWAFSASCRTSAATARGRRTSAGAETFVGAAGTSAADTSVAVAAASAAGIAVGYMIASAMEAFPA